MRTIKIVRSDIVNALLNRCHAGATWDLFPYLVSYDPANDSADADVVFGTEVPYKNWAGELPETFLDFDNNDFTWEGDDEESARDWISENLLSTVILEYLDNDDVKTTTVSVVYI